MKKIKLPGSSDQASLLWHFVTRLYKLAKTNPTSSDEGWERVGVWSGFGLFEDTRDIKAVILTTELSIHLKDKFKLSQDAWDKWVMEGEPEGKDNVVKLTLETVNAQFPALFEDKDTALDAFQVAK
jgi:hypothetical protein